MTAFITQYKLLFLLSWIFFYLIFPSWISLHSKFQAWGFLNLNYPFARSLVILGLIIYFSISAYLMNRYFNTLIVDKPVIIKISDWVKHIKSNLGLVIVCFLSVILHIYTFSPLTVLNEVRSLDQTFWMYDTLNKHWHRLFNFPIQYFFWSLIGLLILIIKQKKMINFISNYISEKFSAYKSNNLLMLLFIFFMFSFFTIYSYFFPYYSFDESLQVVRYPPLSRFLYLITYFAFGISYIGPRIVQFMFYMLSAVYLYRTIHLFHEKETAVLGATIYLFSPIIFSYASRANLAPGTIFFIILISYFFLRFIRDENNRDLILTTYFLGMGFLYKRVIVFMFIICFIYLLFSKIKKRDWNSIIHFKILLLSLIPILPWLKIGKVYAVELAWSRLISFDSLSIIPLMIQSQISLIIFFLFLFSIGFSLFTKRDDLSLFFGLIFITYFFLFTLMTAGEFNHRYLMSLYPAIAVFLAQFIFSITQKIRWKHTFKLFFSVLAIYLIVICLIPRSSSNLITWKYKDFETQYFPVDKATDWIRNRTEDKEKILVLYMIPYKLYVDRIYPDNNGINQEKFIYRDYGTYAKEITYPLQNLKKFCYTEKISYVMFPFSPNNSLPPVRSFIEKREMTEYLKDNMGKDFINVAKFNIEDNYIFIYKLKENIMHLKE